LRAEIASVEAQINYVNSLFPANHRRPNISRRHRAVRLQSQRSLKQHLARRRDRQSFIRRRDFHDESARWFWKFPPERAAWQ
jgi:hypothetical protein